MIHDVVKCYCVTRNGSRELYKVGAVCVCVWWDFFFFINNFDTIIFFNFYPEKKNDFLSISIQWMCADVKFLVNIQSIKDIIFIYFYNLLTRQLLELLVKHKLADIKQD